jgi:hypothetical protein
MSVEEIKEIIRPCGLSPMKSTNPIGSKRTTEFEFLEDYQQ